MIHWVGNSKVLALYLLKGCDSNFEVYIFQILKFATNEKSILH